MNKDIMQMYIDETQHDSFDGWDDIVEQVGVDALLRAMQMVANNEVDKIDFVDAEIVEEIIEDMKRFECNI